MTDAHTELHDLTNKRLEKVEGDLGCWVMILFSLTGVGLLAAGLKIENLSKRITVLEEQSK